MGKKRNFTANIINNHKKMKNAGNGKFIAGTIIGAVLGVAGAIFAESETGKALGENIKKNSHEFLKTIAPKLKKIKKLGQKEYDAFMEVASSQYAKSKALTAEESAAILKSAKATWKHIKKHL